MSSVQIAIIAILVLATLCNVIAATRFDERTAMTYIGISQLIHQVGSIILAMYVFIELC